MTARVVAAGVLIACAVAAWLAIVSALVARVMQATVAVSLVYVALLALRGHRAMRDAGAADRGSHPGAWPWVTVVIAAHNEAPVIGTAVASLAAQQYEAGGERRFNVVVVDDGSDDGTGSLAAQAGPSDVVTVMRRAPVPGPRTKGAALRGAPLGEQCEVVGVVDADAAVDPMFLAQVMAAWEADPGAVAIQAQRRSCNVGDGWLAAAQDEELVMDMASQCGRRAMDGTAELRGNGMFVRRVALERIGGWEARALTEDLEISTRLVRAGERIALAPTAEVREEAVVTLPALFQQRLRWAEGSMRRLMELGPGLLADRKLGWMRKLDFVVFTTEFIIPPLFLASVVASLLTIPLPTAADWTVPASLFAGYGLGTFLLALAGLAAHGELGARLVGRSLRGALFLSHWLVVVPVALVRILVFEPGDFVQTRRLGHRAGSSPSA